MKGKHFQTNVDSQISAMSYLDLILRSVTEPGLLRAFVKFLLDTEKFDGERIIDTLIERLSSTDANLCMVTMALFDTLLGLHCEDLMIELLLKYLLPGKHVPISYRHKINKMDPYTNTADFFLELTPDVMKRARELTKHKHIGDTINSIGNISAQTSLGPPPLPSPTSSMSKTIGANWNYYGVHTGDSLYSNFHAYLFEAHFKISHCRSACAKWANSYKYQKWPPRQLRTNAYHLDLVKQFFIEFSASPVTHVTALQSNHTATTSGASNESHNYENNVEKNKFDSLQSIGESSGYESFKWRPAEEESGDANDTLAAMQNSTALSVDTENESVERKDWRVSSNRSDLILTDLDYSEDLFAQGTVSLGKYSKVHLG